MIEILLATHNSQNYLKDLLDSLLGQTVRDIRIIVSDDGSTDGTMELLRSYASQNKNIDILPVDCSLGGAKENFFNLIGHAHAEYIMFADHDDVWYPDKAADTFAEMLCMEKIYGEKTPLLVHTDLEIVDEDMNTIAPSMMRVQKLSKTYVTINKILAQNQMTGCTMMVNRALIGRVKYTNIKPIVMHDWWIALIAAAFGEIRFLDKATIHYRQHSGNEIGAVDTRGMGYAKENLSDIENLQKKLKNTYLQAEEFYKTYGKELSEKNAEIVRSYADFININKFRKWARLFRYNYFKYGIVRKIGQFILG